MFNRKYEKLNKPQQFVEKNKYRETNFERKQLKAYIAANEQLKALCVQPKSVIATDYSHIVLIALLMMAYLNNPIYNNEKRDTRRHASEKLSLFKHNVSSANGEKEVKFSLSRSKR